MGLWNGRKPMRDTYLTRFILIGSILALTVLLTVTSISSVLELWSGSVKGLSWLLPLLMTPIMAGICAVVCYLLFAVVAEMLGSRPTRHKSNNTVMHRPSRQ